MNFTISRVLVPVDFSPHSELALRYATALAGRLGASVDLLHVVEDPVADLRKTLIEEGERRLERYWASAGDPGVHMVKTVRMGPAAEAITEYAKALGIDLIVMGTHGRSGLAHLFMGSVAERVVRHAPCPVLTLRDTAFTPEPAALGSALGHLGTSRE